SSAWSAANRTPKFVSRTGLQRCTEAPGAARLPRPCACPGTPMSNCGFLSHTSAKPIGHFTRTRFCSARRPCCWRAEITCIWFLLHVTRRPIDDASVWSSSANGLPRQRGQDVLATTPPATWIGSTRDDEHEQCDARRQDANAVANPRGLGAGLP